MAEKETIHISYDELAMAEYLVNVAASSVVVQLSDDDKDIADRLLRKLDIVLTAMEESEDSEEEQ